MKCIRILFLIAWLAMLSTNIKADNSSLHWQDIKVAVKINSHLALDFYDRIRWREFPYTTTYQACIQRGLKYNFNARLSSLLAFRYEIINRTGYYEFENRTLLEFAYKLSSIKKFDLSLAQRTELRFFTRSTPDNVRLRFRGNVEKKVKIMTQQFVPSISGELFWDSHADEINRFRLYMGSDYNMDKHFSTSLYYIREFNKGARNLDIIDTVIKISF